MAVVLETDVHLVTTWVAEWASLGCSLNCWLSPGLVQKPRITEAVTLTAVAKNINMHIITGHNTTINFKKTKGWNSVENCVKKRCVSFQTKLNLLGTGTYILCVHYLYPYDIAPTNNPDGCNEGSWNSQIFSVDNTCEKFTGNWHSMSSMHGDWQQQNLINNSLIKDCNLEIYIRLCCRLRASLCCYFLFPSPSTSNTLQHYLHVLHGCSGLRQNSSTCSSIKINNLSVTITSYNGIMSGLVSGTLEW